MQVGSIIVHSQHKELLSSFLCHVFDIQAQQTEQGILMPFENLKLLLIDPLKKSLKNKTYLTELEFFFENREELRHIKEKLEFSWYRLTQTKIRLDDGIETFRIYDFDGRPWRFSILGGVS